ncbi:unnamed protein product [Rodentolepis nana]|uniref:N-acetyltransferase domain-containing protein n=1 Tax=Rodentolepis nana TaxID=102285 RepID=A0A0R3T5U2_RODNA|nr:unnamed protein product [Rodentolepis nana]
MFEECGTDTSKLAAGLSRLNIEEKKEPLLVDKETGITFRQYQSEIDLDKIVSLITKTLSEPYSLYTYRYFIYNWPDLCLLAIDEHGTTVGTIVCKLDYHVGVKRGYIAMLAVEKECRRKGIGSKLVQLALDIMIEQNAQEVVLEAEVDNKPALGLYEQLGFCRDKYLFRYYLTGKDAFRLKLWVEPQLLTPESP